MAALCACKNEQHDSESDETSEDDAQPVVIRKQSSILLGNIVKSLRSLSSRLLGSSYEEEDSLPDLSGTWNLERIEGDFDQILVDAGVSWMMRMTAKASNYGAGLISQKIVQDSDGNFFVEYRAPGFKNPTAEFSTTKDSKTQNEDGAAVIMKARWEASRLWVEGKDASSKPLQKTCRYLQSDGTEMVQEMYTSTGVCAKRIFKKE
jgi:hypothetical protein